MKRRDFVKRAAAVSGAVGISGVAAPAIAQSRRELTIVGFNGGDMTSAYTGQPINRFLNWLEQADQQCGSGEHGGGRSLLGGRGQPRSFEPADQGFFLKEASTQHNY